MIEELVLQNYNRPISSFTDEASRNFILDPKYQRGSVWDLEQRRNLILSVLQGLPIGALFLNERSIGEYAVVDGKQRIETLQMFVRNEFAVPREWFHGDDIDESKIIYPAGTGDCDQYITFSQLTGRGVRHIEFHAVATYETHFRGEDVEAQEMELFERINFGGTPQPTWKSIPKGVIVNSGGEEKVIMLVDPEAREALRSHLMGSSYMGTGDGYSKWILDHVAAEQEFEDSSLAGEGE